MVLGIRFDTERDTMAPSLPSQQEIAQRGCPYHEAPLQSPRSRMVGQWYPEGVP